MILQLLTCSSVFVFYIIFLCSAPLYSFVSGAIQTDIAIVTVTEG